MFKIAIILATVAVACYGDSDLTTTTITATTTTTRTTVDINRYLLYNVENPQIPQYVDVNDDDSIDAIPEGRQAIILVHGHSGSGFTSLNPIIRDAILRAELNLNIIVVDWSTYASLSYTIAVGTVPLIAENLKVFIDALVARNRATLATLHLVGFDLGAHVVGISGRLLQGAVARITGLSPSGSQWGTNTPRLRITDARYVEVIHTDGRGLLANGIGTPLGNVDFFANGGNNQPGCYNHSCCHERAFELFAASMINPSLVGYPCSSTTQLNLNLCRGLPLRMGGTQLTKFGSGIYRINTKRTFPF